MLLSYPLLKAAALPLLTAIVVGSCTASYFRIKIDNLELEWRAQVAQAEAQAMAVVLEQQKITEESERAYQTQIAALDARYADAANRLRNASKARRMSDAGQPATVFDAAAGSSGLPDSSGVTFDASAIADLLRQADENTQKLLGLQAWLEAQRSLSVD